MSDGESTLSQAADAVEEASNAKALDVLARSGFAVMALLHIIVGAIAIAIAFGHPGDAEATGAIARLADNPWGPLVMWGCVAACLGLALWQASEATLRARSLPRKERLAKLVSSGFLAIAYGSVGLTFAGFALGQRSDSGDNTRDFSASLMANPVGPWVLVALGLTILGIGIYFVVKGLRRGFKEELFHFEGTRQAGSSTAWASPAMWPKVLRWTSPGCCSSSPPPGTGRTNPPGWTAASRPCRATRSGPPCS